MEGTEKMLQSSGRLVAVVAFLWSVERFQKKQGVTRDHSMMCVCVMGGGCVSAASRALPILAVVVMEWDLLRLEAAETACAVTPERFTASARIRFVGVRFLGTERF